MSLLLLTEGGRAPQAGVPPCSTTQEKLLCTAWLHGLRSGVPVRRYVLFAAVQSHVAALSVEHLQGVAEKDTANWDHQGGLYSLTPEAERLISERYGPMPQNAALANRYWFGRPSGVSRFAIGIDASRRRLEVFVGGERKLGSEAVDLLRKEGENIPPVNGPRSDPAAVLNWILRGAYHWTAVYDAARAAPTPPPEPVPEPWPVTTDAAAFHEGRQVYRLHWERERNSTVVEEAKRRAFANDPLLRCQVCGFSFVEAYGEVGSRFIEAHHTRPLSELRGGGDTRVEELAMVCSNCHRMLHRRRPWLAMAELQDLLVRQ